MGNSIVNIYYSLPIFSEPRHSFKEKNESGAPPPAGTLPIYLFMSALSGSRSNHGNARYALFYPLATRKKHSGRCRSELLLPFIANNKETAGNNAPLPVAWAIYADICIPVRARKITVSNRQPASSHRQNRRRCPAHSSAVRAFPSALCGRAQSPESDRHGGRFSAGAQS